MPAVKKNVGTYHINFRLHPHIARRVKAQAKAKGLTMASYLRLLIELDVGA